MKKKKFTRKEMKEKKKRTYKCHWSDYCLVWSQQKQMVTSPLRVASKKIRPHHAPPHPHP